MNAAIEQITAEITYQTEWAAHHKKRGNAETAAVHRGTAAGLKRALAILTADEASPCATWHTEERVGAEPLTH
jgi:hypothetical protein